MGVSRAVTRLKAVQGAQYTSKVFFSLSQVVEPVWPGDASVQWPEDKGNAGMLQPGRQPARSRW